MTKSDVVVKTTTPKSESPAAVETSILPKMNATSPNIPIWLDCDPGHDDAFAILLAAYHENLNLLGISTVYGNAPLSKTTNNALSVLQAIGKTNVYVYPGVSKPISRSIVHAPDIHGESGLDGTDLLPQPDRRPLTHCNAIKDMRDALMSCPAGTAWLVATGTLTNIALMFAVFPEVSSHIAGLSIMGGAIGNNYTDVYVGPPHTDPITGQTHPRIGNTTHFAEFNIWCDPEAAKSIFSNPILKTKTTLVTLDLTHRVCAAKEQRDMLRFGRGGRRDPPTRMRQMFYELLMFFSGTYKEVFGVAEGPPLHDPVAVAVLLAGFEGENGVTFHDEGHERWEVEVVTEGKQVGRTKIMAATEGVFIPRAIDYRKFWDTLEDCMEQADAATGYAQ